MSRSHSPRERRSPALKDLSGRLKGPYNDQVGYRGRVGVPSYWKDVDTASEASGGQCHRDTKRYDLAKKQTPSRQEEDRRASATEEFEERRSNARSRYGLSSRGRESSFSPKRRERFSPEYSDEENGSNRGRVCRSERYRSHRSRRSSSTESRTAHQSTRRNERRAVDYGDLDTSDARNNKRQRKKQNRDNEADFSSRYLYNPESGLWYDQETGTYSYYDENFGGYVPWEAPPLSDASMRLVVLESEVLEAQKLVIVDSDGLSVGRDRGTDKRLRLPEMLTSKFHANVYLQPLPMENLEFINSERLNESLAYIFCVVDCGSQHGTFVNETRLSESKVASQPFILSHLDILKIGSTSLQVHLHASGLVCDACSTTENNVIDLAPAPVEQQPQPITLKGSNKREALEAARKQELKRLKRQFAGSAVDNSNYTDRAALRRQMQPDSPPAATPSVNYVPPNHGARLLQKHGWEQGQGLGSHGQGIVEPVTLQVSENRTGLGYGASHYSNAASQPESLQQATRRIYRQRFQQLQ
ncbi:hypothetical protein L0F63_003605 [Massospora cicadina]|nr:hypothetical protein L0F63_003605 [Massospora cicadina]